MPTCLPPECRCRRRFIPVRSSPFASADLAPLFPMALIAEEVSTERYIEIPDEVQEILKLWRPTPLYRARRRRRHSWTPAHIYYKYEGVSPSGSHKTNTAVAQAYYNKEAGVKRITTETGAGQWGSVLSFACQVFGIECKVYMVQISYEQKPYRKLMMQTWGATVANGSLFEPDQCRTKHLGGTPTAPAAWVLLSLRPWKKRRHERTRTMRWAVS